MMHVGFDGVGYQTSIARSNDLLHWKNIPRCFHENSFPAGIKEGLLVCGFCGRIICTACQL